MALKQGILIGEGSGSVKVECVDFSAADIDSSILPTVPLFKECEVLILDVDTSVHIFNDHGMPNLFMKMQSLIQFTVKGEVKTRSWVGISAPLYPADKTLTALNEIPTLRTLELEQLNIKVSEDTCSRIKGMIRRLTALRVIECNGFDTLMNCVAQSLMCTTSLVELEMSDNCIFETSEEIYVNLFRAIKGNGTLKKLDVSKIGSYDHEPPNPREIENIRGIKRRAISMELLEAVYEMLSCNNTLEELYLFEWNLLGPDYVSFFRKQKISSSGQKELNPRKLEPMAKGLVCNHTLLKLGIESSSIGPLKLQIAQLKETSASKHPGPNPNLYYTAISSLLPVHYITTNKLYS